MAHRTLPFSSCLIILTILLASKIVADAKSGCASFGHSCFGGMGKRGSYDANPQMHQDDSILNVGNENGMPIKLVLNNKLTASDLTRYIINQWVTNYLRERDDFNEKK
ncbi:neuropeptide CCHamide-2 isoform X2 [Cylas formicarius]|uniref:neuropeptide CCHamide-2 isoform X2 n=1 Tax=Cylas formicarius TaxID=197179 RepID=UPI002958D4C1|nr:neuropeptide CCHamide-2 isoform X2 [Cylas formicarius]